MAVPQTQAPPSPSSLQSQPANETTLPYFHGALLNEDADKLLVREGDFLVQTRHQNNLPRSRLILAVRKAQRVRRFELRRLAGNAVMITGRSFPDLGTLVQHHQIRPIDPGNGDFVYLKRGIPRGQFQLSHKDIRLLRKIGAGAYGIVYKGAFVRTGSMPVAVKHVRSDGETDAALVAMMKEARVMQLYDHKNIVKFFGFIVERTPFLLIMELCPDGSVEDKLRSSGATISIARRVDMSTQTAHGVEYLHIKGTIHRDLAARNLLLNGSIVKIADFGMCRATSVYKVDLTKPQNVRWLAPEVWTTGETKACTDIYALGVTIWELFEQPYNSPYCTWKALIVKDRVSIGYRLPPPLNQPESVAHIMQQCWAHDANARPTAADVRRALDVINMEYNAEEIAQRAQRSRAMSPMPRSAVASTPLAASRPSRSVSRIMPATTPPGYTQVVSRVRTPAQRRRG